MTIRGSSVQEIAVAGVRLYPRRLLAAKLHCCLMTIDRLRKRGELAPTYIAGRLYFSAAEIRRWIRSRTGAGGERLVNGHAVRRSEAGKNRAKAHVV